MPQSQLLLEEIEVDRPGRPHEECQNRSAQALVCDCAFLCAADEKENVTYLICRLCPIKVALAIVCDHKGHDSHVVGSRPSSEKVELDNLFTTSIKNVGSLPWLKNLSRRPKLLVSPTNPMFIRPYPNIAQWALERPMVAQKELSND